MLPPGELTVSAPRELLVMRSVGCGFEPDGPSAFDTILLRDETGARRDRVPRRMPEGDVVETHDEEVVWGGVLNEHFGHFLTESVSRLWPLLPGGELEGASVVFATPKLAGPSQLHEWLDAFGARIVELPERGFVRFTRMRVPEPAWRLNTWVAPEIRDIHLCVRQRLDTPPPRHNDTLWMSRQGLGEIRVPFDEALLEWILGSHVTIVEPETLPLTEQIAMLEGTRAIAGVMGSAFHMLLMTTAPPDCLYLCPPWEKSAYRAQNCLLEGGATFASAMSAEWTHAMRKQGRMIFPFGYRISIPAALRALRDNVLPDLFDDARIAAFAGASPGEPETEIDAAASAVIQDPSSSEARLRLGAMFEATDLRRCALDQYRAATRTSGSEEAARRAELLTVR